MFTKSMRLFMFATLAILMASACVMFYDADESDAASVSIGNGQTKAFNLVNDLGWYEEPFYDDFELQFTLYYTDVITGKTNHVSGSPSGSWNTVTFTLPVQAKVGSATLNLDVVNPEDGEIVDNVTKTITVTDQNGQGTQSSPFTSIYYFAYSSNEAPSSSTMNIYVKEGGSFYVSESFFSTTKMTAIGSSTSVTSLNGITKTSSGGRDTYSGNISGNVCIKFNTQYTLNFYTVASGGSSATSYTCYLYYNANGGSGAPSTQSYTGTSTSSHSFTVSSSTPTRSGYTFLGWSTSSSATSATYTGGSSISVSYNGSKTLYAVWQQNVTSYTVTIYKGNWESFQVLGVDSGVVTANSKSYSVESGKRLDVDWYGKSDETGTGTNYTYTVSYDSGCYNMASSLYGSSLGDSVTVTKNASYYPAQEMGSTTSYTYQYTIKYNANGGSGAPSNTTATASTTSKSITLSSTVPTRSGYTFLGWSTSSSATSASYQAGTAYSFNYGTTQLYAVWKQATITVTGTPDSYGVVGSAWSFKPTVSVSGCSVSVSGANWLSANGTNISGTPTSPGTYNVTLTFAKSGYTSATKTFSITVLSALDFTSSPTGGAIIYAV